jgi:hypothetical protein
MINVSAPLRITRSLRIGAKIFAEKTVLYISRLKKEFSKSGFQK